MINKTLHRKLKTVKPEFQRSSQMLAFNTRELGLLLHALYNNISVISWRSVLFVEETGVPGENHRSVASHWQILSHTDVSSTPLLTGIWT